MLSQREFQCAVKHEFEYDDNRDRDRADADSDQRGVHLRG